MVVVSPNMLRTVAVLLLMAVAAYLTLCAARPELPLGTNITLRLPTAKLALQQLAISVVELVFSATALWYLLPHSAIGFPSFLAFYAIAITLGIISHVPGGLGVFEATLRSEEHTSELQSLMRISYAVFCLKKKHRSTKHHAQSSYRQNRNRER